MEHELCGLTSQVSVTHLSVDLWLDVPHHAQTEVPLTLSSYLEEGEVAIVFHVSDLQVAHDDLAASVHVLEPLVLLLRGARQAQAVLRTQAKHWRRGGQRIHNTR